MSSPSSSSSNSPSSSGKLEALEAIARFGFLAHDIKDGVNQLSTLGVVTLGPVVTSTSLAEDEVVGHLGGRDHGVGGHDTIGVFLTDLGDQKGPHTGTGSTTH